MSVTVSVTSCWTFPDNQGIAPPTHVYARDEVRSTEFGRFFCIFFLQNAYKVFSGFIIIDRFAKTENFIIVGYFFI